ncbi:DNA-deoxyinosine glycosylase [Hyphomicrobium sp.]|uniref:DNA-deoxyinosine glycosylase n=1 Tax=Hyphomicrobium sp. TaxID=82 RepID=UPI002E3207E5|nr:DNA-deoxyinosine glycosylase [Hyphomicrobium sp.]HEX2841427.1 DNA-deoxyinosine glycosylase [Hyphomicrobium sp.]
MAPDGIARRLRLSPADKADSIVCSFAPIATSDARLLILGSMPGAASLAAGQYYAHAHNAFWRIMGELVGAGPDKPYEERERILRARGIALWDVLSSCVRPGSLDSDIRAEVPNDFETFFAEHRRIARVGLNGGKAAATFKKYAARHCPAHVEVCVVPSTSPAHAARSFEQKCAIWRAALLG